MNLVSIPVEKKLVLCRHGDGMHAVGKYKTPEGCVCFPHDREQDLCAHHVMKDGPKGPDIELVLIYDLGFYERWLGKKFTIEEPA